MATHGDHRGRDCNGFQVSLNQEIEISQSVTGERQEKQNQCNVNQVPELPARPRDWRRHASTGRKGGEVRAG